MGAEAWHSQCLGESDGGGVVADARRRYHRAWLEYLHRPESPPLVSVVMPAYNPGRLIREAVVSALDQHYPRIEVVVVDDGSTERFDSLLEDLGPQVRILRTDHRGPAAARNEGVRRADGEIIHFLDADDSMEVDAVAAKMEALRLIPDATLCFSDYHVVGSNLTVTAEEHARPPIGDQHCPTRDLLSAATRRFVFQPSTVLAARWVLLDVGPFDTRLRLAEDGRCWFVLGLRATKVAAIDRPLVTRRLRTEGLSSRVAERMPWWGAVGLMALRDLLERPEHWRLVGRRLHRFRSPEMWNVTCRAELPLLEQARNEVLDAVGSLPRIAEGAGRSATPVAAVVVDHLERRLDSGGSGFHEALLARSRAAIDDDYVPSDADAAAWLLAEGGADARHIRAGVASVASKLLLRRGRRAITPDLYHRIRHAWPQLEVALQSMPGARDPRWFARMRRALRRRLSAAVPEWLRFVGRRNSSGDG